ncbi:phage portal protein [Klebsiella aerogenes]|uniref:phage portal protein n=1 Tax=Klebsiella aerogenes TaxID=548 RepID=UPI002433C964|nr:phage portal protein [Klebsiella aerogenes]EME5081874.1 phage portal protein [Klebsiella aerogenes]WFW28173.1 phage portal protein [Klebsiella aerogenes]HBV6657882.1 phage portal protein [Klebsiella aerogenes]HBV9683488.1 phage portal protein [Klebsiella aerogenes]HDU2906551.1 phage portal protein [Klebsiella aerogenes]
MADTDYSIDLRTRSPFWARMASILTGGRLVTPDKGSQMAGTSAHGVVGDSVVTDERNMQISTVWACIRLISTVTASLPLDVYQTRNDQRTKVDNDNPLAKLLRFRPNNFMTALEFREAMTMQLCAYGNAYAHVERNSIGDVISMVPLMSANMEVRLSDNGKKIIYRYRRDTEYAEFSQKEIFHLKGFGFNGLTGLSPLAFSAKSAGVAIAMEDNQREFFANGAKSPQILMTDGKVLTKEQRGQLEENFKEIAGGPVKKRLWILESGFTTQPIGVSPQDSEILAARKFQVAELARFYGVPPHLVGDVDKTTSWGSGIEQQNLGFLQYTLKPYLDRWEYSIERWLVKESEQGVIHAEHNLDGLLRGDSASRASFMQIMVNTGIRTVNEVRRLDNLPPLPGGDVATRQSQNVPITDLGTNKEPRNAGA